jgi:serine/threonine protein kinase/tetratricopeptide (TPR) repeat protein
VQPDDDKTRTHVPLTSGAMVSHYRIIEKIGAGGMGEVYLAEDTNLNRKVALKFLPLHLCQDADYRARFKREAQAAAKLNHPNIVTIHEVGEFHERPFIVSEYAGGQSLGDIIIKKQLTPSEAINTIVQVCEGLEEAHNAGIVHRDIKPSNIVLEKTGHPKIVDFGLAAVQGAQKVTKSGSAMGTVGYMSPEQLRGTTSDRRTDLFSVGVVLYELITGKNPFAADNEAAVQNLILTGEPEPMARFKSGIPDGLQEVVNRALEKDAQVRYQSAADMAADLRRLRRRSSDSVRTRRIGITLVRLGRPKFPYVAAVGAVLVVLLGVFWMLNRSGQSSDLAAKRQLAVLPFVNLGIPAVSSVFCDGLMETITSKLTQLADFTGPLSVVPSSEVRDKKIASAAQARRVFGIDLAVTGSVQNYGDRVRITLNLVDAVHERQLRSTVINEQMSDLPVLQDLIVGEMAQMLDVQLQSHSRQVLSAGWTNSSDAYYSYLQGQGFLQQYANVGSLDSALRLFGAAIRQDSTYALAYAGLGEAYWRKYQNTMDNRWVTPAIAMSSRALELNDHVAPVLLTLGIIHRGTGQYEEAVRYLKQALALDSMNNEAYKEIALALESLGRQGEAESTYQQAVRLRPDDWQNYYYLAMFNFRRGLSKEALAQTAVAESLAPAAAYPYYVLGSMYIFLGMNEKAKALLQRSISLEPSHAAYSNLGVVFQGEQQDSLAMGMYEHAVRLGDRDYRVWINLAAMYKAHSGRQKDAANAYDSAIVLAERARAVNPQDAQLLCHLADCYASIGRQDKALELARQAVQIAPGDGEVLVRAGLVYEGAGKRAEALSMVTKAVARGFPLAQVRGLDELHELVRDPRFDSMLNPADLSTGRGKE